MLTFLKEEIFNLCFHLDSLEQNSNKVKILYQLCSQSNCNHKWFYICILSRKRNDVCLNVNYQSKSMLCLKL